MLLFRNGYLAVTRGIRDCHTLFGDFPKCNTPVLEYLSWVCFVTRVGLSRLTGEHPQDEDSVMDECITGVVYLAQISSSQDEVLVGELPRVFSMVGRSWTTCMDDLEIGWIIPLSVAPMF